MAKNKLKIVYPILDGDIFDAFIDMVEQDLDATISAISSLYVYDNIITEVSFDNADIACVAFIFRANHPEWFLR